MDRDAVPLSVPSSIPIDVAPLGPHILTSSSATVVELSPRFVTVE